MTRVWRQTLLSTPLALLSFEAARSVTRSRALLHLLASDQIADATLHSVAETKPCIFESACVSTSQSILQSPRFLIVLLFVVACAQLIVGAPHLLPCLVSCSAVHYSWTRPYTMLQVDESYAENNVRCTVFTRPRVELITRIQVSGLLVR